MCATGFVQLNYVKELPISTCEGIVCRHLVGICHIMVTYQLTRIVISELKKFCEVKIIFIPVHNK